MLGCLSNSRRPDCGWRFRRLCPALCGEHCLNSTIKYVPLNYFQVAVVSNFDKGGGELDKRKIPLTPPFSKGEADWLRSFGE